MRLKRVKIFGFKTFADRTEFDIEGDLTAVVGSNGCGKSNLVDAILWGLGEASPRHLRAATGTDVIFNGSARRKPLGFAEVTLLFDNEDGSLPLDAPEVSVTRRLTRAGDSEYRLNRAVCRQRDVFEVFADSGLGRTGYAIVGQKEIDTALSASPEDRRSSWLDEAAGVQRYRTRKVEAQRRLNAARTHLERTADILSELEAQREPLREEAEVAQRYKTALSSLREVETGLLVHELRRAVADISAAAERGEASTRLAVDEAARADKLDHELHNLAAASEKLDGDMEESRTAQQAGLTAAERTSGDLRVAEQKLAGLDELESSLGSEADANEARLVEAREEVERAVKESEREEGAYTELRRASVGSDEAAATLSKELKGLERELEHAKQIEAKKMKLGLEQAHRDERIRAAKRELNGILSSEADTIAAVSEAEIEESAAIDVVSGLRSEAASLHEQLAAWQKAEDDSAGRVRSALAERAGLQGRIQGVESTLAAHEGLSQGARAVLEAVDRHELTGTYLPVGEAISADAGLTLAIETALGASVNDLIVDTEAMAKDAVAWLKANRAGRATFQPIPLMRPTDPGQDFKRLLNEPGVVGSATDLIQCAPKHRPVIESLLSRVLITETIEDALQISRRTNRPFRRIVTLDGEVVHAAGSVTGGANTKQGYGLVQRKSDLQRLEKELAKLDTLVEKANREASSRVKERDELAENLAGTLAQIKDAELAATEARQFANALRDEAATAAKAKARLERELSDLAALRAAEELPEVDSAAIEGRRHELLKSLAAQSADAEGLEARLLELEQRRDQARTRHQAASRRLENLLSAESQRSRRLENLGPERARLGAEVERLTQLMSAAQEARGKAEARLHALQVEKRELTERSIQIAETAKTVRETLQSLFDANHQAELVRTRAEGKRAAALGRLLEEYGIGELDALSSPDSEPPADAAALVSRLRRDLRAMGDVNVGAIEAYSRLTTRYDELQSQQADILQGISDVELSISELDNLTRDKFERTYELVRTHFAAMVKRLFGGGDGLIELTDPKAILDSGIDIAVTLPGKKRQQLGLLSGGERSLCAMAFLFALLEVKCSPLVVLDEVDAPLDGVNVERFASLLKDYSSRTQFIVITHNRETIAAAPMWLGVTMQEPGVSTLIPYREARAATEAAEGTPAVATAIG